MIFEEKKWWVLKILSNQYVKNTIRRLLGKESSYFLLVGKLVEESSYERKLQFGHSVFGRTGDILQQLAWWFDSQPEIVRQAFLHLVMERGELPSSHSFPFMGPPGQA